MKFNLLPDSFVETLSRQLKMIKLIGIDIFDESENFAKKYGRLIFINGFFFYMIVGQILYIVKKDEIGAQFLEVVSAIPTLFINLQDYVKMLVVSSKRNEIREVIMRIGQLWPEDMENEEKLQIVKTWVKRLKFFDDAFFTAAIICLVIFELLPLAITINDFYTKTNAQYLFPVLIYFFCNLNSHHRYVLAYVYQCVTLTIVHMCIYISCEFLLVDLIFDLSLLLNLLKIDLEKVVQSELPYSNGEEDNCEDIRSIVINHQKLLSIADDMNRIFGLVIFTQVSFSSVVICCYGFMGVVGEGLFLKYFTATLGMMLEIFILSYPGQTLADTSSAIADAAYQSYWYRRGKQFRKYITIIMARSQKPCYLSALGFSNLSLAMFSKVLSTSWSYLSLLNQMYKNIEF